MLSLVMLSVGTAFAADDIADTVAADEIAVDESLSVEQDTQAVSDSSGSQVVITPENVGDYIDGSGKIKENVTADEFVFNGAFENLNLTVERPITLTGEGDSTYFYNPNIEIYASNVTLQKFSISQEKGVNSIFVGAVEENRTSDVTISEVDIHFTDDQNMAGAIPIQVMNSDNFILKDSYIWYVGNTNGYYINNAVRVVNSRNAAIYNNRIAAELMSVPVGWSEEPAGSGNWVSSPMSEAVVIKDCENATFDSNNVTVLCQNASGSYDTIYSVDVSGSGAIVTNNNIIANGNTYIYGIILSGDNFIIRNNDIDSFGVYYANGIDIEGPATGVVENNNINVEADSSVYGIYSGMNGQNVSASYSGNNISGSAYNVFGMSVGDVNANVSDNFIDLTGNYTTGLAYRGTVLFLNDNNIVLTSSEVGNESIWEGFGVEAVGVKVIKGTGYLTNNTIATPGKGVSLTTNETSAYLEGNFINVVANDDKDAYAIYTVDASSVIAVNNTIDYQGATKGNAKNKAVYIKNLTGAIFTENTFNLDLVSAPVSWEEVPAGSGNWVSSPISEGIVIEDSDLAIFEENVVNATYGDVVGAYDTIYVVDVKGSDNARISSNDIKAKGNTYIYGIIASGNNLHINDNTILSEGNYYANGIDIEGPATAVVENNYVDVRAENSAYGIYSGMNGQDVSANYTNNTIAGKAYNIFGMSVGDVNANVSNNFIDLTGNYTTGLAYRGTVLFLDNNNIVLTSSEVGNESIWEGFGVEAVGVKIIKGTGYLTNNTIATQGKGVSLTTNETSAYIDENFINVVANDDKDAYAIYAVDASSVIAVNNTIDYQGATKGNGINRAVYVKNLTGTLFTENTFNLDLVSSYVPWAEVPAGSGNWVSSPVSEGIVIEDSDGAIFGENVVNATFGDVVGSYDTIYVVDFKGSDNAHIISNDIKAKGNTYIYGIIASGNNLHITDNSIFSEGDYYANGIDIEGPATAVVEDNFISVSAKTSAYAIYSGMNGQDVSTNYTNNSIMGEAYNLFGMSVGDTVANVAGGRMDLIGNYTTGIAYRGSNLTVSDVVILLVASNKGNESIWEAFGVETIGVKVVQGNAQITNNHIVGTGNYTVDVKDTKSSVHDNYLKADTLFGDASVTNMSADAEIYNNTPIASTGIINIIEVDGNGTIIASLTDTEGRAVPWAFVSYSFNNTTTVAITEDDGTFKLENLSNGKIDISFDGNFHLAPYKTSITLKDIGPAVPVKVTSAFNITDRAITIKGYAVDGPAGEQGIYYATELLDENGNPIQNVFIEFAVNNKIYNRTTDENGSFNPYKLNMVRAGRYTMAFNFAGDENYTNAFACVCVDLDKKPIKIKASDKSYKVSTKTKKYTVTLSTIKGLDGKMYLSPKKVSLTINGKTYTAKSNSNGKVTFKITNLTKKAKYKAKISYEGDKTYESATKSVTITAK